MDLQSDSEDEVDVVQQDQDEVPWTNEETASSARKCGTPGCDLADGHLELCTTQQVTGPRRPSVSVQTGQAKEEAKTGAERTPAVPANHKAKVPPLTAAEARAQATSEGLTLESSTNKAGYLGVKVVTSPNPQAPRPYTAVGCRKHLGCFATAEEAALAYARANSHATVRQLPRARPSSHIVASRRKAAKRAAPPPKPPRTKQARQATAARPSQAVPPPVGVTPAVAPTPAVSSAETLQQKVGRIKAVLQLDPALPLVDAIKAANELMEIAPAKTGLPSQVDTLLATIG